MAFESSFITDIAYLTASQRLLVSMPRGTYLYKDVPEQVATELILAESKGTYFNRNIRNKYVTRKLGWFARLFIR